MARHPLVSVVRESHSEEVVSELRQAGGMEESCQCKGPVASMRQSAAEAQ